jgi:hypothetical protein
VGDLKRHIKWFEAMPFLKPAQLRAWRRYCSVAGVWQDHIVLHIDLGALVKEVRPGHPSLAIPPCSVSAPAAHEHSVVKRCFTASHCAAAIIPHLRIRRFSMRRQHRGFVDRHLQASMAKCQQFPTALVSLIELAVRKLLAEDGVKPSQLVTLLHVGDITLRGSLAFSRIGSQLVRASR